MKIFTFQRIVSADIFNSTKTLKITGQKKIEKHFISKKEKNDRNGYRSC